MTAPAPQPCGDSVGEAANDQVRKNGQDGRDNQRLDGTNPVENDKLIGYVQCDPDQEELTDVSPGVKEQKSPPFRGPHEGPEKRQSAVASIVPSSPNRKGRSYNGLKYQTKVQRPALPANQFLPVAHQEFFHSLYFRPSTCFAFLE
jgi:hypothetical protein